MIRCHIIFDCKEDGRRKAQFVGGGHLTAPPKDSVYSSVASLCSIRLVTFLSQLHFKPSLCNPDVWYCNAGDCYEYMCTYVDDLLDAMKNPSAFMKALQAEPYNY